MIWRFSSPTIIERVQFDRRIQSFWSAIFPDNERKNRCEWLDVLTALDYFPMSFINESFNGCVFCFPPPALSLFLRYYFIILSSRWSYWKPMDVIERGCLQYLLFPSNAECTQSCLFACLLNDTHHHHNSFGEVNLFWGGRKVNSNRTQINGCYHTDNYTT